MSAENEPQLGDWSYLLLFTSGGENVIEFARFEHAFTGLQIHFSRAVIRDSVFSDNREGLRFGRAELAIENNEISNNDIGIHEVTGPFPAPEKYWRVPDMLGVLDEKCGFSVDLPPGRYYVGAIQRRGGQALIGPPSVGDMYYAGNTVYDILPEAQNNLDVIRGAKPFSFDLGAERDGVTVIEGSVLDLAGKAVESALVFAHKKQEMTDRPLFVSTRTGKDGVYRLRVSGGGTFYLRVRNSYGGGMPVSGAIMGVYGGGNPKAVTVKKGEVLKGINLTGIEFAKPNNNSPNSSVQ